MIDKWLHFHQIKVRKWLVSLQEVSGLSSFIVLFWIFDNSHYWFFIFVSVIWYQSSVPNYDIDGIKWKNVIEFPNASILLTLTQFLRKCSEVPNSVNDIVINGTFASHLDYSECAKAVNTLPNLRRLALVNCQVNLLQLHPSSLWSLTDLAIVNCHCYNLPIFLPFVGPNLRYLDLSRNFINELPPSLAGRFPQLRELRLAKNRLVECPQVLSTMLRLHRLHLSNNQLLKLDSHALLNLHQLTYLDISYNLHLDSIPAEIVSLPQLKTLNLTGLEGLKTPPYQLAVKGLPAMQKYFAKKNKFRWFHDGD